MSNTAPGTIVGQFDYFEGTVVQRTQDNIDELQDCVIVAKEFAIDVRDALGIVKTVRIDAGRIANILEGLERVAQIATKVPPISNAARKLEDVLDTLGGAARKVENVALRVENRVEPVREVLRKTKDALEKTEDKLGEASDTVGEVQKNATAVQGALTAIEALENDADSPLYKVEVAKPIEDCLDQAVAPANYILDEVNGLYAAAVAEADGATGVVGGVEGIKNLLDLDGQLNGLKDVIDLSVDLEEILNILDVLEGPLNELEKVITKEVEDVLDAVDAIYDAIAAPVIDPILEATGIDALIQRFTNKLEKLLPDADIVSGVDGLISDIEAGLPDFDGSVPDVDLLEAQLGIDGITAAFVPPSTGGGVEALPLAVAPYGETPSTGPLSEFPTIEDIAGSITLADGANIAVDALEAKADYWRGAVADALDLDAGDDGGVLIGSSNDDTLTRTRNGVEDIILGGAGNDRLDRDGGSDPDGVYDVFIGGEGDDDIDARGQVVVSYSGLISDYFLERVDSDGARDASGSYLTIEHLGTTGTEEEGKDLVRFNHNTLLSFDGFQIEADILADGLKNLSNSDPNFPIESPVEGSNDDPGIRNFVFGSGNSNTIETGALDDLLVGRGGRDFLYGGGGDDFIDGGEGVDQIFGGNDDDLVDLRSNATDQNRIFLDADFTDNSTVGFNINDLVEGVERVVLGAGDDTAYGSLTSEETIDGGQGDDLIRSSGGNGSSLDGREGDDTLILDTGSDSARGRSGDDLFFAVLQPNVPETATGPRGSGNVIFGGSDSAGGSDTLSYRAFQNDGEYAQFFANNPDL